MLLVSSLTHFAPLPQNCFKSLLASLRMSNLDASSAARPNRVTGRVAAARSLPARVGAAGHAVAMQDFPRTLDSSVRGKSYIATCPAAPSVAARLPERGNRLRCLEMPELNAGKGLSLLDCSALRPRIGRQPLHRCGRGVYLVYFEIDARIRTWTW